MYQEDISLFHHIKVLAPTRSSSDNLQNWLQKKISPDIEPFAVQRSTSLNQLSQLILSDSLLRNDPASVALAFWLRRTNVQKIKEDFFDKASHRKQTVLVPVGLVFHIAPANVDTLFVYSWALAYLCGNTNIVRLSTKSNLIVERLIQRMSNLMENDNELQQNNRFITYDHNDEITKTISAACHHRIIWGGNETVTAVRELYLNPHASERLFSSKFSYALISASKFCESENNLKEKLMVGFFNDMFWFDQMACSSPHIVFWIGTTAEVAEAMPQFNILLEKEAIRRHYQPQAPQAVKRLNFAFDFAVHNEVEVDIKQHNFISLRLLEPSQLTKESCGGGLLTHIQIDSLTQLSDFASQEDQTITHFGLSHSELRQLARLVGSQGVDRVVPIGQALAFSPNWDGYDLIEDLLHRVVVIP